MGWEDIQTKQPFYFITINWSGNIAFNSAFVFKAREEMIHPYVRLYYSKSMNAVMFEFTSENTSDDLYKIASPSKHKESHRSLGRYISSKGFFPSFSLKKKEVMGRYKPRLIDILDKGLLWVIFLDEKEEYTGRLGKTTLKNKDL